MLGIIANTLVQHKQRNTHMQKSMNWALVYMKWNSGCGLTNNNVWFFSQHQRLGHHIDSSDYDSCNRNETSVGNRTTESHVHHCKPVNLQWTRTTLNTNAGAKGLKLLRDLKCQLPGRGEDEGMKPLGGGQQWLEDGQSKGTSLSWTSLCQANNIPPWRHRRMLIKLSVLNREGK